MSYLRAFLKKVFFRKHKVGDVISRFIAPDIKREVLVTDTSALKNGRIECRMRTYNVLYLAKGLVEMPPFDEPHVVPVKDLWK